jgi:hypothetical protein
MSELNKLIARQEMRLEQLIIHVRQNRQAPEAEIERRYLLALLEDLVALKTHRQELEDHLEFNEAA